MTDKRSCRDFLSDLSLGIIHKILALVPIKDAVRTSILSRKWRYKWTSLPELTFFDKFADEAKRKHFVHQALLLHDGPIQKFKLHVWNMERCSYTDQWLIFLSRKDIRKLILDFRGSLIHPFQVHSSLYCCQNLTHLELFRCAFPPLPPTFKGFLYLRRLLLQYVDVPSAMIGYLVGSSPLLEELSFDNQKRVHYYKLITRSPNLKCLSYSGFFDEICWYAPLLAKLKIFSFKENFTDEFLQQRRPVSNYAELLGGFLELEEFSTNFSVIKYLTIGIGSCQRPPVFLRLRLIELRDMGFDDMKVMSVVLHLIVGAPNLQKLIISCDYPKNTHQ